MSTPAARTDAPLASLAGLVGSDPGVGRIVDRDGVDAMTLRGPEALRPFVSAALSRTGTVLVVTATAREGEDLVAELGDLIGSDDVAYYPAWETLPHERLSPRSDTVGRRLAVLRRLVHADPLPLKVVVAPVRSLLQPQVKGLADLAPVNISTGDEPRPRAASSPTSLPPPTSGSTLSSDAVSSPCAVASSTSSRPPRSTRCGWSSGVTPSRRSVASRWPTSARSTPSRPMGATVPRAAAHRRRPRAGRGAGAGAPLAGRAVLEAGGGARRRRHGVPCARAGR